MELFTGLLTVGAGLLTGALVLLWLVSLRSATARQRLEELGPSLLGLAAVVAVVTVLGSLWFSESAGFTPCKLCWFQRIAAFPMAVILPIAAYRRDVAIRIYVLPVLGLGMLVSTYHYLGEWNPGLLGDSCAADVPCSVPYFRQFGFLSLAAMAWVSFATQGVCLALSSRRPTPQ